MKFPGTFIHKKEKYCPMYDAPLSNLESMAGYIKAIPRQGIVVIDNNIIPDADVKQLKKTKKDSLDGIIKFNSALAETIQNFASDRVIITPEARAEMNAGFDFMKREIKKISGDSARYWNLLKSYDELSKKVNSEKRLQEAAAQQDNLIYTAMKNIARKRILDSPSLKKKHSCGDEPDERIVANAFAEAITQDKKVYILSCDPDIRNIAADLYALLTCRNSVGVDTISSDRLRTNNVEVVKFDTNKNLFTTEYNAKTDTLTEWKPSDLTVKEQSDTIRYVQKQLIPVEVALGNGKALAALVKKGEESAPKAAPVDAQEVVPKKPAEEFDVLFALERIYARIGIDPEQFTVDDQEEIKEAISLCHDFESVYKKCGLSTGSIETTIIHLESKTLESRIEHTEEKLRIINKQIIALRQRSEYLRASEQSSIRIEEKQLEERFAFVQKELLSYTQKQPTFVPFNIADLDKKAKKFIKALEKLDAEKTDIGIWASNTQISDALSWHKVKVGRVVRNLEKEKKLKREVRGRYTFNLLTADVIKEILSK